MAIRRTWTVLVAVAIQFREQQPNAMHEGHRLWLTTLKDRSEKH